jgi:hypothetical protein
MENNGSHNKRSLESALWGDIQTTTLENRVFNILMFMVFIVGFVQTAMNVVIGQELILSFLGAAAMLIGLAAYLYSLRTKNYKPFVAPVFILFLVIITIASFLDNGIKGSTPYLFFIPVVGANIFLKNRSRNIYIAFTMFLLALLLIAECCFPQYIYRSSTTDKMLKFDFAITIILTVGVVVAILRIVFDQQEKDRERLAKAYAEIAALQGILPICSKCKKIRDDKGYWNKLEAYMKNHKKIEFTHGLCPDCLEKMLSDRDDELEGRVSK